MPAIRLPKIFLKCSKCCVCGAVMFTEEQETQHRLVECKPRPTGLEGIVFDKNKTMIIKDADSLTFDTPEGRKLLEECHALYDGRRDLCPD